MRVCTVQEMFYSEKSSTRNSVAKLLLHGMQNEEKRKKKIRAHNIFQVFGNGKLRTAVKNREKYTRYLGGRDYRPPPEYKYR
jgi:hypothetical protein